MLYSHGLYNVDKFSTYVIKSSCYTLSPIHVETQAYVLLNEAYTSHWEDDKNLCPNDDTPPRLSQHRVTSQQPASQFYGTEAGGLQKFTSNEPPSSPFFTPVALYTTISL